MVDSSNSGEVLHFPSKLSLIGDGSALLFRVWVFGLRQWPNTQTAGC